MMTPLDTLRAIAENLGVVRVSAIVLDDPRFAVWPASAKPGSHHYKDGGLVEHTCEVAELCLLTNGYYKAVRPDKAVEERDAFLAALFHDSGKMHDYRQTGDPAAPWGGTDHKRRIHHVSRSGLIWNEAAGLYAADDGSALNKDDVWHAILSHHGRREWGSPVAPATRLAWLLHLCDGISARLDDCYTHDRID